MKNYMYVLVRSDLSKPQQAVQSAHAAIESTKQWPYRTDHPHLVILSVKDQKELEKVLATAEEHGIMMAQFHETDVGMTAVASRPVYLESERKVFRKYNLLD